jgi:hypothetical protein
MTTARRPGRAIASAPVYLALSPLHDRDGTPWNLRLEPTTLTLLAPGDKSVLTLHRDEAARYMRFDFDLFRNRTITFVIVEGLKSHTFRCTKEILAKLLAWLPNKSPERIAREVRRSGLAVGLFGVLHLVLFQYLPWWWGVCLLGGGFAGLVRPQRALYAVNGALMAAAGLWNLVPRTPAGMDPRSVPPEARLIPIAVGSLLVLWGIQQIAMLGPNQQLRASRTVRDEQTRFLPDTSRLVQFLGRIVLGAAGIFGLFALLGWFLDGTGGAQAGAGAEPRWVDAAAFGTLCLLGLGMAAVLLRSKRPVYMEAKLCAQALIAIGLLCLWGIVYQVAWQARPGLPSSLLATNFGVYAQPYPWVVIVGCVVLFNRWFNRAMDRELEEQRG